MFFNVYLDIPGPGVPDVPLDEMTERDLRNLITYLYAATEAAVEGQLDEPILDILTEWYDEVFVALAEASETFRDKFRTGLVFSPRGRGQRAKYMALVNKASES